MPPRIGIIPPSRQIGERVRLVAARMGWDCELILRDGVGEISRAHARDLEREGVDVIITRGINVDFVQEAVATPVVEIPVSGQDLALVLHNAKKLTMLENPRIALFAFSQMQQDVQIFADLFSIDLRVYPVINDFGYIRRQVALAKQDGVDIVVAGNITGSIVREHGLRAMMLDSGEVSLRNALHEARTVAYARRLEKVRTRRLQAVVDISGNGIFVMDADNSLRALNTKARKILRVTADVEGARAETVLPGPLLARCLAAEEPIVDEVFEIYGVPYLLASEVVKMGSEVLDRIFTLQPVAAISELESKLRKSLHARGLTCQYSFNDIWGVSRVIQNTIATARSFAATDSPILLMGETGTGKELFAQAIHQVSPYASGPFVAINCASLPSSLLESELFGHEEGAFTGARRNGKPGLFEMANNGTIFLDEVSEMNHYGQTRLLRVLQERCTMRIGGDRYVPVTARVIAASNRNLPELVERKRFRQDLFYRLNVLPLTIPPLRDRHGDIALLARRFAELYAKKYGGALQLTPDIMEVLEAHSWPGNVRELSGIMERLALLARATSVSAGQVAEALRLDPAVPAQPLLVPPKGRDASERGRIVAALEKHHGHQGMAARELGIHRSTLQRKMKSLGIQLARTPV